MKRSVDIAPLYKTKLNEKILISEKQLSKHVTVSFSQAFRLMGGVINLIPLLQRCESVAQIHELVYPLKILAEYVRDQSQSVIAEICNARFLGVIGQILEKKNDLVNSKVFHCIVNLRTNADKDTNARYLVEKYLLLNFNIWWNKFDLYTSVTSSYSYYKDINPRHLFEIFRILFRQMPPLSEDQEKHIIIQDSRQRLYNLLITIKDQQAQVSEDRLDNFKDWIWYFLYSPDVVITNFDFASLIKMLTDTLKSYLTKSYSKQIVDRFIKDFFILISKYRLENTQLEIVLGGCLDFAVHVCEESLKRPKYEFNQAHNVVFTSQCDMPG